MNRSLKALKKENILIINNETLLSLPVLTTQNAMGSYRMLHDVHDVLNQVCHRLKAANPFEKKNDYTTLYSSDYRSSKDPTRWKVKIGAHQSLSKETGFEEIKEVKNVILHPKYWGKTELGVLAQPPHYDVGELKVIQGTIITRDARHLLSTKM